MYQRNNNPVRHKLQYKGTDKAGPPGNNSIIFAEETVDEDKRKIREVVKNRKRTKQTYIKGKHKLLYHQLYYKNGN